MRGVALQRRRERVDGGRMPALFVQRQAQVEVADDQAVIQRDPTVQRIERLVGPASPAQRVAQVQVAGRQVGAGVSPG